MTEDKQGRMVNVLADHGIVITRMPESDVTKMLTKDRMRFSKRCYCPRDKCAHYERGMSPGTDYCEDCVRGYLGLPDKYEPREG